MKATPAITALSAQINHASGLPLNRAQRRAAKRRRPHQVKQIAIRAAYARISNGQLLGVE